MVYMRGWWVVLTLFEGGTVEGYFVSETEDQIEIRNVLFMGDEPSQSAIAVDREAIIQIDAYRERPPR